jgi:hypothetical protein
VGKGWRFTFGKRYGDFLLINPLVGRLAQQVAEPKMTTLACATSHRPTAARAPMSGPQFSKMCSASSSEREPTLLRFNARRPSSGPAADPLK